jgi:hypothetical protein
MQLFRYLPGNGSHVAETALGLFWLENETGSNCSGLCDLANYKDVLTR